MKKKKKKLILNLSCVSCGKKTDELYGQQEDMCWDCYLDYSDEMADVNELFYN